MLPGSKVRRGNICVSTVYLKITYLFWKINKDIIWIKMIKLKINKDIIWIKMIKLISICG
jgi:hypothetical protein